MEPIAVDEHLNYEDAIEHVPQEVSEELEKLSVNSLDNTEGYGTMGPLLGCVSAIQGRIRQLLT